MYAQRNTFSFENCARWHANEPNELLGDFSIKVLKFYVVKRRSGFNVEEHCWKSMFKRHLIW